MKLDRGQGTVPVPCPIQSSPTARANRPAISRNLRMHSLPWIRFCHGRCVNDVRGHESLGCTVAGFASDTISEGATSALPGTAQAWGKALSSIQVNSAHLITKKPRTAPGL